MGRRTVVCGLGVVVAALLPAPAPAAPAGPGPEPAVEVSWVDPLAHGRSIPPGRTTQSPTRAPGSVRAASRVSDGAFRTSGIRPRAAPEALRPWRQTTDEAYRYVPTDDAGVRVHIVAGVAYNHPVGQAQYGLVSLETFRRGADPALVARARAQADRLVATRVVSRDAWFYPYRFDFTLARAGGLVMRAPWYSGMAQAEALALFTHLARMPEVPAAARAGYREAADRTFRSLTLGPARGRPWVSMVDPAGYLWLQEYPGAPPGRSDFTYNGHLFAALGLWDYATLTNSAAARRLFDGAATTARRYASAVRRPGNASSYCVAHEAPTARYHQIHVELLTQLQWLTGRAGFAARADAFAADYPDPDVRGQVRFAPGRHAGYQFGPGGRMTSQRTLTLRTVSYAPADQRVRIRGRGVYYRVTAGSFAGRYVRERPGRAVLLGVLLQRRYDPPLVATLAPGSYRVAVLDARGAARHPQVRLARQTRITYDRYAVIDGVARVRVSSGPLVGHWFPAAARHPT